MAVWKEIQRIINLVVDLTTVARVTEVDAQTGVCKVMVDGKEVGDVHPLVGRAGRTVTRSDLSVGERVLVLPIGGNEGRLVAIKSLYTPDFPIPASSTTDEEALYFSNGDRVTYNHATRQLFAICDRMQITAGPDKAIVQVDNSKIELDSSGNIKMVAPSNTVSIEAANFNVTAASNFTGPVTVTGVTNITGPFTVSGLTNFTGAFSIGGATVITGALAVNNGALALNNGGITVASGSDISVGTISLMNHRHGGVRIGVGSTGPPA